MWNPDQKVTQEQLDSVMTTLSQMIGVVVCVTEGFDTESMAATAHRISNRAIEITERIRRDRPDEWKPTFSDLKPFVRESLQEMLRELEA